MIPGGLAVGPRPRHTCDQAVEGTGSHGAGLIRYLLVSLESLEVVFELTVRSGPRVT
jgi:hypothetical protein